MSITLSQLLSEVSLAVQKANNAIDEYAALSYIEQGYDVDSEQNITPKSYTLLMSDSGNERSINVPITTLINHSSLKLDEVDFKLKVLMIEDEDPSDDKILVDIQSAKESSDCISEINLHFKAESASEGKARIQSKHIQEL